MPVEVTPRYWLLERSTWKWSVLALLVRGGWFWIFLHSHGLHHGAWGWGAANGDTGSYFDPIDSYLSGNAYRPDMRMPGYGVVYLLFRWFTTVPGAGSMVILVQLFFSALSCAAVFRCGGLLGMGKTASVVLFGVYTLFPQVAFYDVQFLSESLCMSALVLAIHDWLSCLRSASPLQLVMAGLWITWAIFLRPVQALLLPVMLIGIALGRATAPRHRIVQAVIFLLPFLLLDGAWTTRNWIMHHRFRPLANSLVYPWSVRAPIFSVSRYVRAYGGNHTWWDPTADIRWFNVREGPQGRQGPRQDDNVRLPNAALSEHVTLDSLRLLADEMASWSGVHRTPEEHHHIARNMEARVDRYIAAYRADRPFSYHALSRIRMLGHLLARSGQEPLFEPYRHRDPPMAGAIILLNDVLYWTIMPLALLGSLIVLIRNRRHRIGVVLLSVMLIAGVLVHPMVLRFCQGRYLVPMLPLMCMMAAVVVDRALRKREAVLPRS
jgi:hypothetical protein